MTQPTASFAKAVTYKILYVLTVVLMLTIVRSQKHIPVGEIMFFRSFFSILPVGAVMLMRGQVRGAFRTKRPLAHVGRTILGMCGMGLTFLAVQNIPLPETVTLQYSQPLFVVAFSAILLGETVGIFRWSAVVVGFAGVLVVTWPNLTMLSSGAAGLSEGEILGVGAALLSSAVVAMVLLAVSNLVRTENGVTITLYFWLVSSCLLALTAFAGWEPLDMHSLVALLGCGILGGIAQLLMAASVQAAPPSTTAAFEYTSLIFASVVGYLMFGDLPGANTLIGGAIVIAAGLAIIHRERQRNIQTRRPRDLPPQ